MSTAPKFDASVESFLNVSCTDEVRLLVYRIARLSPHLRWEMGQDDACVRGVHAHGDVARVKAHPDHLRMRVPTTTPVPTYGWELRRTDAARHIGLRSPRVSEAQLLSLVDATGRVEGRAVGTAAPPPGARRPACPSCYMQMPASGVCDCTT